MTKIKQWNTFNKQKSKAKKWHWGGERDQERGAEEENEKDEIKGRAEVRKGKRKKAMRNSERKGLAGRTEGEDEEEGREERKAGDKKWRNQKNKKERENDFFISFCKEGMKEDLGNVEENLDRDLATSTSPSEKNLRIKSWNYVHY